MTGVIRIAPAVPGAVLCRVTMEPPIVGMMASQLLPSFDHALGYATGYSIALNRPIVDEVRGLSMDQIAELTNALIADGFDRFVRTKAREWSVSNE